MVRLQGYECRRLFPQDLETSLTPRVLGQEIKKTFENRLEWVELGKSSFKVLTLSESVLSRDPAANEYGDSERVC
jgi:hypothetical protein